MKIGVISDTHARTIEGIHKSILKALETVDLIVHAGDFTEKAVLDGLKFIGQVKAVCGNMDSHELKNMLPQTELLTLGEKRIGLVHGSGGPWGITGGCECGSPTSTFSSLGILTNLAISTFVELYFLILVRPGTRSG
jgi:3',5'-cyclic AMP phosphodiesterase CpdA